MVDNDSSAKHPGLYAERTPERPAVVMVPADGRSHSTLTFAAFEALSNQCAHLLRACNLKRGDGLAIYMENNLFYTALARIMHQTEAQVA